MKTAFDRLFSKTPFGLRRAEDSKLVEDAAEQNVLDKIIACRAAGMSFSEIAAILTRRGITTKTEATDGR